MGVGDGTQEEPSPGPWKHVWQGLARTTCASGATFQKRLVRPVPSKPRSYGGLPGSLSQFLPSPPRSALDHDLTEKQLLPLGKGTSVLVWEQRRAVCIPRGCCPAQISTQRPLVPLQDRASGAAADQELAWPYWTHGRSVGPETACTLTGLFSIPGHELFAYWPELSIIGI